MSLIFEQRASESPYLESVTRGWTVADGAPIRPAESHWHMVFARYAGSARAIAVGPLTTAGMVQWSAGAEVLWIKFRLGMFMPHLPTRNLTDGETVLPEAASRSFWLKGSAWQVPGFEEVETFVDRLVRERVLVQDSAVSEALQGRPQDMSPRTLRHRFLQATGLPQNQIHQIERAQRAAALLEQGSSILEAVHETGYFDQPHLTRSLRQWVGRTPGEILRTASPA